MTENTWALIGLWLFFTAVFAWCGLSLKIQKMSQNSEKRDNTSG
ncbi:hypothetical protein SAMN05444724_2080 [Salinivibrio sp. ES.052]|nr:hypothetical protein SAMN05444724_2080 [Salinivibrio sp. ES.052]